MGESDGGIDLRTTHPRLVETALELSNNWLQRLGHGKYTAESYAKEFGNGVHEDLVSEFIGVAAMASMVDSVCLEVVPVLFSNYDGPAVADGSRIKKVSPYAPAVLGVTDDYLIEVAQGDGSGDESCEFALVELSTIVSVRRVKCGGALCVPKLDGLLLERIDGEALTDLFYFLQFTAESDVAEVRARIESRCGSPT